MFLKFCRSFASETSTHVGLIVSSPRSGLETSLLRSHSQPRSIRQNELALLHRDATVGIVRE
jgi:hypothetical protein